VSSHVLRVFERAAVLQKIRDAGCSKRVIANRRGDAGHGGAPADHTPGVGRLRDEHGYIGGLTIVKDYVLSQRQRQREVFVPLRHDPGHAQVDFGEALAVIGGIERKIHFFAMDLAHSDAGFVQAYPAETTEAFCAGHVAAFAFVGGVPR
jgi:hypothetical protein